MSSQGELEEQIGYVIVINPDEAIGVNVNICCFTYFNFAKGKKQELKVRTGDNTDLADSLPEYIKQVE
jgi:hypothetical protein